MMACQEEEVEIKKQINRVGDGGSEWTDQAFDCESLNIKRKSKLFNQPMTSKEQSKIYLSMIALCSIYVSVGCFSRDNMLGQQQFLTETKYENTLFLYCRLLLESWSLVPMIFHHQCLYQFIYEIINRPIPHVTVTLILSQIIFYKTTYNFKTIKVHFHDSSQVNIQSIYLSNFERCLGKICLNTYFLFI